MIAATMHRRWAREYLTCAQHAKNRDRKRRYLRLAVTNTVCARKLEKRAHESDGGMEKMSRPRTGRLQ
jgi:hypothetical protein